MTTHVHVRGRPNRAQWAMGAAIARAWRRLHKPRVRFTVEPVLFLFMFASFLSYPVFQQLLESMVCEQTPNCSSATQHHLNSSTHSRCYVPSDTEQVVQSKTSHWILYINLASGLPSIVVAPIYGSLSDQLGRRFFMALPAIGSIINTAVILVAVYLQPAFPIPYLLLGAFVSGLYGSFSVMNFAVYSYASDISGHSKRTVQISVLESMTYLSATLSFIVGGLWLVFENFAPPFWSVMGCQCVVLLYIVLFLPESLQPSHPFEAHALTLSACRRLCSSVVHNLTGFGALLRLSSWRMITLLVMFFIVEINFLGITDTVVLYTLGEPLCWSPDWIGYFLALKVFLNGLAALLVLPVLVYFKMPDTVIVMVGLVASAGALVLMGLATHTWMMLIGM